VQLGLELLGKTVNPFGTIIGSSPLKKIDEVRSIEIHPPGLSERKPVDAQMETGVALIDIIVPLGKGQRELVIGDRKTGKTEFLYQTMISQAQRGIISIYAVIGQKQVDTLLLDNYLKEKGIRESTIIVSSGSSDAPGLIYLTPYVAMTIAEYFRDQGKDVLLILDDMTTHARSYREISLLAKRLPGRGSYPGDIFYTHARLVERAGAFLKGSITCLPVAESILGDLSGYIQTNLMSMTDGHIFFDIELYNQGNRPSVNPFLSVTRVGHQTQGKLQRELSNSISSFLVVYDRMKQFMHFGTEASESARNILAQGARLDIFFNQGTEVIYDLPFSMFIVGCIWAGKTNDLRPNDFKKKISTLYTSYSTNVDYKTKIGNLIHVSSFSELVTILKRDGDSYFNQV
jgi:F-type H+/Na+-transporting ATPase subunit alpha